MSIIFQALENLELIDVQLREGFGEGLVKMQSLKKLLVIPVYKDEVRYATLSFALLRFTILALLCAQKYHELAISAQEITCQCPCNNRFLVCLRWRR